MPERKQGLPRALRLRQGSGSDEACGRDEASESYGEVVAWEALVPIVTNPCIIGDVAKMLGYPVGRWWRLQHPDLVPADHPRR